MRLALIILPQLLSNTARSLVVYKSPRLVQRTQNPLVYSIRISQGSVAPRFGCGGIFNGSYIANFLQSVPVKTL